MGSAGLSGTERAIVGDLDEPELRQLLDSYLQAHLGSRLDEVIFRAGRIDAVWALRTGDGRDVVVKAHRPPVDLRARRAASTAQAALVAAGFACPTSLSGPDLVGEVVLSAETLTRDGHPGDPQDPAVRRAIARGLHEHVQILRTVPGLVEEAGPGPAWCRYSDGPWPTPHDSIFDFTTTPAGYAWLDDFARDAADLVLASRQGEEVMVGHADWYLGNLRFGGGRVSASVDWELTADTEAVIAGFSAGCFNASATAGVGLPAPAEVAAFLTDYEHVRGFPFSSQQQRAAAGAAAWTLAYNARCELGMLSGEPAPESSLAAAAQQRAAYLDLSW